MKTLIIGITAALLLGCNTTPSSPCQAIVNRVGACFKLSPAQLRSDPGIVDHKLTCELMWANLDADKKEAFETTIRVVLEQDCQTIERNFCKGSSIADCI